MGVNGLKKLDQPVGGWWAAAYCKGDNLFGHSGFPSDSEDGKTTVLESDSDTSPAKSVKAGQSKGLRHLQL